MTFTAQMTDDLRDALEDAQYHLREAISQLEFYVRESGDSYADAYILDHLKILAGRDHGFLSDDTNLDDLLDALADRDEEEEELDDEAPDATIYIAGQPRYWCQSAGRYVSVPEDEE